MLMQFLIFAVDYKMKFHGKDKNHHICTYLEQPTK